MSNFFNCLLIFLTLSLRQEAAEMNLQMLTTENKFFFTVKKGYLNCKIFTPSADLSCNVDHLFPTSA